MVCGEAIAASSTTRANSSANSNSIWLARFLGCVPFSIVVAMAASPMSLIRSLPKHKVLPVYSRTDESVRSFTTVRMTIFNEWRKCFYTKTNSERADACHVLADNQRMNIVRAFVRFYRLQVHQVAHHGVIIGNAVCSKDVTRHARALQGHPYVVSLGHGNVLVPNFICVLQAAHLQRQKLRLGDFADHPCQLLLDKLMRCNRLVTELLAYLRILQGRVIAGHGRSNRAPANAVTRLIQAA